MFSIPFISRSFLTNYSSLVSCLILMLPFVSIEICFSDYSRSKGDIASCNDPHWPRRFVLSTNQFCRKGKLSSVNRMYFWMFKRWYVCQYNQMYCTWCYYIIIKLGPFWLDLITKGVPHLKQSCPLLMFQNFEGVWAKLDFLWKWASSGTKLGQSDSEYTQSNFFYNCCESKKFLMSCNGDLAM